MSNESWLTDGDCRTCRRLPYCKKTCRAHKEWHKARVLDALREAVLRGHMAKKEDRPDE